MLAPRGLSHECVRHSFQGRLFCVLKIFNQLELFTSYTSQGHQAQKVLSFVRSSSKCPPLAPAQRLLSAAASPVAASRLRCRSCSCRCRRPTGVSLPPGLTACLPPALLPLVLCFLPLLLLLLLFLPFPRLLSPLSPPPGPRTLLQPGRATRWATARPRWPASSALGWPALLPFPPPALQSTCQRPCRCRAPACAASQPVWG